MSVIVPAMMKISARLNDDDFLGTAEDLAHFVSDKLSELGFGDRHKTTERLVRFYTYENLLSRPERASDDRRKANFGQLQVRQLLLARLLSERGWDLDRIRNLLKDNAKVEALNDLIDELAIPTEAEKLFFRTRSNAADAHHDATNLSEPSDFRILGQSRNSSPVRSPSAPSPRYSTSTRNQSELVSQINRLSESSSPASTFKILVKKQLIRDDISQEAKDFYRQLMSFNPTSKGDEPKRERWTRLRLAHWCEAHLHIDGGARPTVNDIDEIVANFRKSLIENYI